MSAVSVVMAVYNGRRYLRQQVDSILVQLVPGDELIVVDDASTDGSLELLGEASSPPLVVHRNPSNLGVRRSFERGLQLARHELIFLADQDDVWKPGKRAAYVDAFAASPKASVVISDAEVIDAQGQVLQTSFMATRGGFDGSLLGTLWRNRYLGCAMAFRRSLLDVALPVPAAVPMHDMWLGAIGRCVGEVVFLPAAYLQYRRHGGNVTPSRPQPLLQMIRWRVALVRAVVGRIVRLAIRPPAL